MVPSGFLTSSFVLEAVPVVDSSSLVTNLILNGTTPVQMVVWAVLVLAILKNLPQNRLNSAAKEVAALVVLLVARAIVEVVPWGICRKSEVQLVPTMELATGEGDGFPAPMLRPKLAGVVVNDGKKHKAHLLLLRLQHIS